MSRGARPKSEESPLSAQRPGPPSRRSPSPDQANPCRTDSHLLCPCHPSSPSPRSSPTSSPSPDRDSGTRNVRDTAQTRTDERALVPTACPGAVADAVEKDAFRELEMENNLPPETVRMLPSPQRPQHYDNKGERPGALKCRCGRVLTSPPQVGALPCQCSPIITKPSPPPYTGEQVGALTCQCSPIITKPSPSPYTGEQVGALQCQCSPVITSPSQSPPPPQYDTTQRRISAPRPPAPPPSSQISPQPLRVKQRSSSTPCRPAPQPQPLPQQTLCVCPPLYQPQRNPDLRRDPIPVTAPQLPGCVCPEYRPPQYRPATAQPPPRFGPPPMAQSPPPRRPPPIQPRSGQQPTRMPRMAFGENRFSDCLMSLCVEGGLGGQGSGAVCEIPIL